MPFLDNLILGKPGGERRKRYVDDGSLTGGGDGSIRAGVDRALTLLRLRLRSADEPARDRMARDRPARDRLARNELTRGELAGGDRRVCGNIACGNGWTLPWKTREHPVFEGDWACSTRCLEALVRSALARETGDGVQDDGPEPHRHRIPLGLVMLAQGWITHPQLQRALEAQRSHGRGRIGEWLVSECGMNPDRIARGLSVQWNCPVLSTESFWPETMALALPRVFLEEYGVLPLRLAGRKILYVGFQDSLDASASFALEQMTGLRTENGILPEAEFSRAREILLRCEFPRQTVAAVSDRDGLVRAIYETVEQERPEASRLVKLHRYYWLRVWATGDTGRAAGELPANASGVSDYLFTIGSRVSRPSQYENRNHAVVAPLRQEVVNEPVEVAEPVEVPAAAGALVGLENASVAAPGKESALEDQITIQAQTTDVPGALVGPESDVAQPDIVAIPEEEPVRHFLALLEPRRLEPQPASPQQAVRPEEPANLQRFMRKGSERAIEPIEGEYLPSDLTGVESTALVPERQPSGWSRHGQLLRSKLSFRGRPTDPASVPGQEG